MVDSINTQSTALMLITSVATLIPSTGALPGSEEQTGSGEGTSQDFDDRVQISSAAMKMQGR